MAFSGGGESFRLNGTEREIPLKTHSPIQPYFSTIPLLKVYYPAIFSAARSIVLTVMNPVVIVAISTVSASPMYPFVFRYKVTAVITNAQNLGAVKNCNFSGNMFLFFNYIGAGYRSLSFALVNGPTKPVCGILYLA